MITLLIIIFGMTVFLTIYAVLFIVTVIPNTMFFASNPGVPIYVTLLTSFKNAFKNKRRADIVLLAFITFTSVPMIILQIVGSPFVNKDKW